MGRTEDRRKAIVACDQTDAVRASRTSGVRVGTTLLLVLLLLQTAYAHKEPVHQYIVREGHELLLMTYGASIPELSAFIGPADPSANGDSAWQMGFVTTGAWREDAEDVVYHYDILPGLNYALTSITHFWSADRGDGAANIFRLQIEQPPLPPLSTDIGPYPNAFSRMMKFAEGGWVLYYPRSFGCLNATNGHRLIITPLASAGGFGVPLSYRELTTFYTSGELTVESGALNACTVWDSTDFKFIQLTDLTKIEVGNDVRNVIVWEVLGRMCHLLADMSVPAHAHLDEHGLHPDSYENYVGGAGDPYRFWNAGNAGPAILLNGPTNEVLHYLMYTTQQRADHFGSNGPANGDGNDDVAGDPTLTERDSLNAVNLGSLGGPTTDAGPWSVDDLDIIRDNTLPYAIRATAGLLYWFCVETGLSPRIVSDVSRDEGDIPTAVSLEQNYPNPFNPTTTIRYVLPVRSAVSLTVLNMLGQQVATLVRQEQVAGSHEVAFDGSRLASGVYFYRLQVRPSDVPLPGSASGRDSEGGSVIGRDSRDGVGSVVQCRKLILQR